MWKVIAALIGLAFIALFMIVNSGDQVSTPDKAGDQGQSASAMLPAPATNTAAQIPASAPAALAAGTEAAPAKPVAAAPTKMSTRHATVVKVAAP